MRVYQCDSCNKVIADPYTVKMKEFYVKIDTEYFTWIKTLVKSERKIKIQLCDDCYKGLRFIAEKKGAGYGLTAKEINRYEV